MEENTGTPKLITPEAVERIDKEHDSPEVCGKRVQEILSDIAEKDSDKLPFSDWDLICFCVIFLKGISAGKLPQVAKLAHELALAVYYIHYMSILQQENEPK